MLGNGIQLSFSKENFYYYYFLVYYREAFRGS